jgi:hypothetical protein
MRTMHRVASLVSTEFAARRSGPAICGLNGRLVISSAYSHCKVKTVWRDSRSTVAVFLATRKVRIFRLINDHLEEATY